MWTSGQHPRPRRVLRSGFTTRSKDSAPMRYGRCDRSRKQRMDRDQLRPRPTSPHGAFHCGPSAGGEHNFSILAGDQGSIWTGNLSMPLTHVAADGGITSFPKTKGTICLRLDRNGAIWSAGGGDSTLWHSSGWGFLPMHYPEEELGPVIALAVDRNNELWIHTATGGDYHLTQGSWSKNKTMRWARSPVSGAP